MSDKAHVCTTCGKQYQHNTHLRRHEATHRSHKFKCTTCDKMFARGDVCRKHMASCGKQNPAELRRGRKPAACEACFMSKASCDKEMPCGRCVARNITCKLRKVPDSSSPAKTNMSFILGMANPKYSNMLDYFENDNDNAGEGQVPEFGGTRTPPEVDDLLSMFPWDMTTMIDDIFLQNFAPTDMDMLSMDTPMSLPTLSDTSSTVFEDVAGDLVEKLHSLHCALFTTDPSYRESFDMSSAERAFSSENIRRFCNAFFRLSHVHFPIVHMPSFGTGTHPTLLIAVALAGAFRIPLDDDVQAARRYMRLVEEYIFRDFVGVKALTAETVQILQATVVVVHLLMLNNNAPIRLRSRTDRLPKLVAKVRQLGLTSRPHDLDLFSEKCTRITLWTAFADWHQCSFNAMPSMTPSELKCQVFCDSDQWNSSVPIIQAAPTFKDCMAALLSDPWVSFPVSVATLCQLMVAIFAQFTTCHLNMTLPICAPQIRQATTRWRKLWAHATAGIDEAQLNKVGMARHAPEMCNLVHALIDASLAGSTHPYFQKVGHDSLEELYSFVKELQDDNDQ